MEQKEVDEIVSSCILKTQDIQRKELDIKKLVLATSPFSFFENFTVDVFLEQILKKHREKSEETIRGNLLECVAIEINNRIQGGFKSKIKDVDLEVPSTNSFYGIKNSPDWGNSNQRTAVGLTYKKMKEEGKNFAVLCLYGKTVKKRKSVDKFPQFAGQDSWSIISDGDKQMFIKAQNALNNNRVDYRQFITNIYNCNIEKAKLWIEENFSTNNKLNINKLNEYISGNG